MARGALQKIFPNHWSFLLGEVALYSFVVLLVTGVFLTFFYDASTNPTTLRGHVRAAAGRGGVAGVRVRRSNLSFDVRAGLVMRQMHHWAALVFLAAIIVHLCRVFFTGAFRRPRELNWMIGLTLMLLAIVNGFAGYSLLDDQLSGTGLRIAYSVLISIPFVGPWLASLLFGGNFPGDDIIPRLFVIHVLIVPAVIVGAARACTSASSSGTSTPTSPATAPPTTTSWASGCGRPTRSRPAASSSSSPACSRRWRASRRSTRSGSTDRSEPENVSSASQPDWYMGWLEGSLRLMPNWETRIGWFTIPNPF